MAKIVEVEKDKLDGVCNLLALASFPTRLRAMRCMVRAPVGLKVVMEAAGVDSSGAMAQQLDLLRHAGLVVGGTQGEGLAYRLTESGRALVEAVSVLSGRVD